MPEIIKILLVLVFLSNTDAYAAQQTDKAAHFAGSALLVISFVKFGQLIDEDHEVTVGNRYLSSGFTLLIGFFKERSDASKEGKIFDSSDMGMNVVGVVYGNLLSWSYEF